MWRVYCFYPAINRYESVSMFLDNFEASVLASSNRISYPGSSFIVLPY